MTIRERVVHSLPTVVVASLGVLLLVLVLLQGSGAAASPAAATRYVAPTGSDAANDCTITPCRTVQHAVDCSTTGDEILVATGVYTGVQARDTMTQVLYISRTVTVRGGYDSDFSTWDPDAYPTTLDAEGQGRVVSIVGTTARPTLEGLTITGGNAHGVTKNCPTGGGPSDGCGGGIFVFAAHPILTGNVVTNNVAGVSTGTHSASGGGLCLVSAGGSVISGNLVVSNTASLGNRGMGGGMHLDRPTSVVVAGNQMLSNVATTHPSLFGWGGGIALSSGAAATIVDNRIEGNRTNGGATGQGAAIYSWHNSSQFARNRVTGNYGPEAVLLGWYSGARFESNWVVGNNTSAGLTLESSWPQPPTLANNVIALSGGTALAATTYADAPMTAILLHNTLVGSGTGTGVLVKTGYVTLLLTNTLVASHTWGITNTVPASSTVSADHTLFWANDQDGIRGTNPVDGDPVLVDYHLWPGSAAIDAGVEAGESGDIDGEPRPFGPAPDIGADEAWRWWVFLPIVMRGYP